MLPFHAQQGKYGTWNTPFNLMVSDAPSSVAPPIIPDQHQGSKSDFGGEVDIEEAIDRSGCSLDYYRLEECLGEHDRDWRRCQDQVHYHTSVAVQLLSVVCCMIRHALGLVVTRMPAVRCNQTIYFFIACR